MVKCCNDNLDDMLLEQLNGFSECGNIMIATGAASKSLHVTEVDLEL